MNEVEWHSCTEVQAMLTSLRDSGNLTERKVRLFAVACCRSIWDLMTDERSRNAVEVAEQFADREKDASQLSTAHAAAWPVVTSASRPTYCPGQAALCAAAPSPVLMVTYYANAAAALTQAQRRSVAWDNRMAAGYAANCDTLRDLFSLLPFRRPATVDAWLTPPVVALAQSAYDDRFLPSGHLNPSHLAELAAALEAAGCGDADLLGHLRDPGPHVRACWAVDAVLGRS